jgi:hypothetical protein
MAALPLAAGARMHDEAVRSGGTAAVAVGPVGLRVERTAPVELPTLLAMSRASLEGIGDRQIRPILVEASRSGCALRRKCEFVNTDEVGSEGPRSGSRARATDSQMHGCRWLPCPRVRRRFFRLPQSTTGG